MNPKIPANIFLTELNDANRQSGDEPSEDRLPPRQPKIAFPNGAKLTAEQIHERFEGRVRVDYDSVDMPGFITTPIDLPELLKYLKKGTRVKYARLEDITAVDERLRHSRPDHDFTLIYHLLSLQVPGFVRIKVPLIGDNPMAPSITSLWPSADWYEREVYDRLGISFCGRPDLCRIQMPPDWDRFQLRMDHPARTTAMAESLNGEQKNWSQHVPHTDQGDYLCAAQNNLAYLHSVETMFGVEIPPRAESIRVLLCELLRIASHLIWIGTFAKDVSATTPAFYAFDSREKIFAIIEMITGGRMQPNWFCIGGVPKDLPDGWEQVVEKFVFDFNQQLDEFVKILTDGPVFRPRIEGVGVINSQTAVDWGVTGPNLRATGVPWDVRRAMPYSGYDRFDFDVVIAEGGDCFARYQVRMGEMRESLKIVRQAAAFMPVGDWIAENDNSSLSLPLDADNHGPLPPNGECYRAIESSKGECGCYAVSDGGNFPYRVHIRTPGFTHMQAVQETTRDALSADLAIILGSVDLLQEELER